MDRAVESIGGKAELAEIGARIDALAEAGLVPVDGRDAAEVFAELESLSRRWTR